MSRQLSRHALALLFMVACSGPARTVDRVTIVNPTSYDLDIAVSGSDRDGLLPLTIVDHGSTRAVQDVVDQGEVWVFHVRYQGTSVAEVAVARATLEGNEWTVEIPAEVEERLRRIEQNEEEVG